jgi:transcription antitermination factor NusG
MAEITPHNYVTQFESPRLPGNSSEPHWYALRTLPRHEKKVHQALCEKRLTSFLPLISELHRWNDRRRLVSTPLFPCYLFIRTEFSHALRLSVLQTRGVVGFVGKSGAGSILPNQQIEAVRKVVDSGVYCFPYPFLTTGQRVRISGGSLDGIEGILLAKNQDHSVVISLHLIQHSLAVRVSGYRLAAVPQATDATRPRI